LQILIIPQFSLLDAKRALHYSHFMRELAFLFLRLGFTAFGGPAAHIAMMRQEVVVHRKWFSEQEFLDLLGATNLIPGPSSTEMALHIGYTRGGWRGMLLAGFGFIVPAMLIVLAFAVLYEKYSALPQAEALLYGIKPVVIALILHALWSLGRQAVKQIWLFGLALVVLALYFLGFNEIALLLGSGILVLALKGFANWRSGKAALLAPLGMLPALVLAAQPFSLALMFLLFLKIGSVLYGSGYVLLAFLRADFVEGLGWLTDRQLLDAVAIGQFTPGPLFTTATFIGYLLAGIPGALLATLGIFLPSFIFVVITNPIISRLRQSAGASAFLDGVNVSALALMAAVTWQLAADSLIDLPAMLIFLVALPLIWRAKINSAWLVLGGAIAGYLISLLI
jgi:chromate transporter